jgi:hypothetical protein
MAWCTPGPDHSVRQDGHHHPVDGISLGEIGGVTGAVDDGDLARWQRSGVSACNIRIDREILCTVPHSGSIVSSARRGSHHRHASSSLRALAKRSLGRAPAHHRAASAYAEPRIDRRGRVHEGLRRPARRRPTLYELI